jgi:transcriptional regulator with XRE-family HTH domain
MAQKKDKAQNPVKKPSLKITKEERALKEAIERKAIVDNVFRLKDERNITNAEFARLLGFSLSTVCSWESRTRGITARTLPRIAQVFNVDISELFNNSPSSFVSEEDQREEKFKRIRSLLYDFSNSELDYVADAITTIWKLVYGADNDNENKPNRKVMYE